MEFAYEQEAFIQDMLQLKPDAALQFFPTAEGFYDYKNNAYIYQYKDHLGNVRISYKKDGNTLEITDSNDYYPFGMNIPREEESIVGTVSLYNYKYNGKELQETGMYDYGARFYMSDIGRWGVVDPLAEKMPSWSPYVYTFNNPVNFVDPTGMEPVDDYKLNKNGLVEFVRSTEENFDRLYKADAYDKNGELKGRLKEGSDYVQVNKENSDSKSIISDLSKDSSKENGYHTTLYMATTNNRTDALDVFQFAALNSTNEWSIQSNNIGGKTEYTLGTELDPVFSPNYIAFSKFGYSSKTLNWDMHSHGSERGTNGPSEGANGDMGHSLTKTTIRFLFRSNGIGNGKVYPYGKDFNNSSLFIQRNFKDMANKKLSNYTDFK